MADPDLDIEWGECDTCAEDPTHEQYPLGECPKSLRPCGHHCNHAWEQDCCHWCGAEFGEDGEVSFPKELVEAGRG